MVPQAIGGDTCGQRMCGAGQPLRKCLATLPSRCVRLQLQVAIEFPKSRSKHFIARVFGAAAIKNVSLHRFNESSNKTWFGTFIVHLLNQWLQFFKDGSAGRMLSVQLFEGHCGSDLQPLAVRVFSFHSIAAEVEPVQSQQIVGLQKIFAVCAQPDAIELPRFLEGKFNKRLCLAAAARLTAPSLGAILPVVDLVQLCPSYRHLRRAISPGPFGRECQILSAILGAEDLNFIQSHAFPIERDANLLSGRRGNVKFLVPRPVFFPRSHFAQLRTQREDLSVQLFPTYAPRMILRQFGKTAAKFNVLKHSGHGVVIADRYWIELVIMTSCTPNRHAECRGSDRLQNLVHPIRSGLPPSCRFLTDGCYRHVRAGNQIPRRVALPNGIAGYLVKQKLIVRLVVVEGLYHVITINPGVLAIHVAFTAVGFRPANDIQPVLRPAFAKMRRFK